MGGNIRCGGYEWEGILDVGVSMGGNIRCGGYQWEGILDVGVINGREY